MEARRYQPHYTFADYEQWKGDWELWDGTAVAMPPSPRFGHQEVLLEIAAEIRNQLRTQSCRCRIVVEHDWRINDDDLLVRPDISVVCRPFDGDFLNVPPTLIVEVFSPSTRDKDRDAKFRLYAEQGVEHYVMVDPDTGTLEGFSLPAGADAYGPTTPTR